MELTHCIYCSKATDKNLSREHLEEILEKSNHNNRDADVTGILLFDSGAFFQVLEGDKRVVGDLFKKIALDSRHQDVTKLIYEPIEQRSFGEWSMGYPKVTRKELEAIPGLNDFFGKGNSFAELEEGRAKQLLEAFKEGRWRA